MNLIDSYEKFCRAFKGTPDEVNSAELLLLLQDWIIRIIDRIDEGSSGYSLDSLIVENTDKSYLRYAKKDAVSRLIDDSYDAVRRISDRMRENIIRENVKMPVYKVREINSYGLNWLSRRPGATIKEKISSSNSSMMAVQRRMSLDTGENRLFIAYLKELADALEVKLENFPERQQSEIEAGFYSQLFAIIRDPDNEEIRRWENMPPNNTLLSDQNYKKIWKCWNELKAIDTIIANDSKNIDSRVCTMFFIELLTKGSRFFRFPQIPVDVDYLSYIVKLYAKSFRGIDFDGNILSVKKSQNDIEVIYRGRNINIRFDDANIQISINNKDEHSVMANISSINRYVALVLAKLGCKKTGIQKQMEKATLEKSSELLMDLFSVRPDYIADCGNVESLKGRILCQTHIWEDEEESYKFEVTCDTSNAILFSEEIETYTVSTAVEQASAYQMTKLIHLLERYVSAQKFTFLFPDIYNEFQLSLVYKAARLVFHEVRSFPRSIGVAFSYMDTKSFQKEFKDYDFLLVMDIVDTDLSLTLIQGIKDDTVAEDLPQYGGIIWERHPSLSYSLDNNIQDEIYDKLLKMGCDNPEDLYSLLGINGFHSEAGLLATMTQDDHAFIVSDTVFKAIKEIRINVSSMINDFIIDHKEIIGNNHVHIVSISPLLMYKGTCSFEYMMSNSALEGCKNYGLLQTRSNITLWRDHLPELAIKLLYGQFNLVDNETITPEFNVEKKIRIDNAFTLPKNMSEYHFNLVQNDVNRKIRYAAVVKNPAFPINHDVLCRLDMTYQYGAENPYRLLFIPMDKDAGFVEAKVLWERITAYPFLELPCPEPIPCASWDELENFPGKFRPQNLVNDLIEIYKRIAQGYVCYDFDGYMPVLYGKPGNKFFIAEVDSNEGEIAIILNERLREKPLNNEPRVDFSRLGLISCDLKKEEFDSGDRYILDLSTGTRFNEIWKSNQYGYSCHRTLEINDDIYQVAFYAENFVDPGLFHPDIKRISFELQPFKENKYTAINIIDEDAQEREYYRAYNLRVGNRPSRQVYGPKLFFLLHTIMAGRESQFDEGSPVVLKEAFDNAVDKWIDLYHQTENESIRHSIFGQMSIVACDIGDQYYDIAISSIDDYINLKTKYVNVNIGYALGSLSNSNEWDLWDKISYLPDETIVRIVSRAIWANPQFIMNVEIPRMLEYFHFAIDYLDRIYKTKKWDTERNVTSCIEMILGTFRLRQYGDTELSKILSLNNPRVQKLYSIIEDMITMTKNGLLTVKSFLRLEIVNNDNQDEFFKDIPMILYALLIFITGEKGASDIKILGIDLDDIEV
ncbi:DUF2357 domain-containing protein [Mediterraneibacter glycyrrhizinilyticus]|uniref:DUF2357 domain-containing protein n=1 Tax=Mediterraneibacter glycyrrhizinilyticus TaxID=342942 RepID=UPI0025A424D7|nr:DUF2357 domain-containing protein [Mediterraneibacter glycyrrhizinilyticus]MDM8209623.1 DUF2357 domain-containing protein [Mediterraneibacter glycyrrhizinilyticus]